MKTKRLQNLSAALVGLAWLCGAGFNSTVQAQITGTNEITFTDFDITSSGWTYGYFYSWNVPGVPPEPGTGVVDKYYTDPLIDPANGPICVCYRFDNTPYQGYVETNSAGYGTGFGFVLNWGFDPAVFNSVELSDYLFSFDARVEGLAPGQTSAACEIQPMIFAGAKILQKNLGYSAGSNWTHHVFTLADGGFGDGTTYTSFTNGLASINEMRVGHNNHMPHDVFGWDDYNVVLLDNLKLEVIQYAGPPPPTVARAILDLNFDDKPVGGGSGGWGWSETVTPTGTYAFGTNAAGTEGVINTLGVGGSSGWYLNMDNSAMAPPNTATWSGIGMNVWGPMADPQWTSPDLADYQISFDCRVEGLAVDNLSATVVSKIFLNAPDDTLQPPDANTADDTVVGLLFTVTAETNWQSFTATLKSGSASDGTSKTNFPIYFSQVSGVTGQFQVENLHQGSVWEFDNNNLLVIDNFKVQRLYVGCPPLTITPSGSDVVLSWGVLNTAGYVQVQRAANVTGPYVDVPGATNSPVTLPAANAGGYFRTLWVSGQ